MTLAQLAATVRRMDATIADVEAALYGEIAVSLLRISKAHPGQVVEFIYDPSKDTTWHVSVGMTPYEDAHLESCLQIASAYAGPVAVPPRHVQMIDSRLIWDRRFKRHNELRDVSAGSLAGTSKIEDETGKR